MRYITRIRIRGFQSHADTALTLHPGVNAITGPSDNGKSAILRALALCLWNVTPEGEWVRKGCTLASVEVVMSDGTSITRERRSGRNSYIIKVPGAEQMVLADFGRRVSEEVLKAHGMLPVAFDPDRPSILNLASQLEPPFFLFDPAPMRARVLGRLAGVHVIDSAIKSCNRDVQAIARDTKAQEAEATRLGLQIQQYADLPDQEARVQRTEELLAMVPDLADRVARLTALAQRHEALQADLAATRSALVRLHGVEVAAACLAHAEMSYVLRSRLSVLASEWPKLAEDMAQVRDRLTWCECIPAAEAALQQAEAAANRMAQLMPPRRQLFDALNAKAGVETKLARLQGAEAASEALQHAAQAEDKRYRLSAARQALQGVAEGRTTTTTALARATAQVTAEPLLAQLPDLTTRLSRLRQAQYSLSMATVTRRTLTSDLAAIEQRQTASGPLEAAAAAQERMTQLQQHAAALADAQGRQQIGRQRLAEIAGRIQTASVTYGQALQSAGVCPTCLQTIDPTTAASIAANLTREVSAHVCTHDR